MERKVLAKAFAGTRYEATWDRWRKEAIEAAERRRRRDEEAKAAAKPQNGARN